MVIIKPRPLYPREITPGAHCRLGGPESWSCLFLGKTEIFCPCQGDGHIRYLEIASLGSDVTGRLKCGHDTEFVWPL